MASLFQRLDEEEAIVRGELDALREKLAEAEERLARLTITRETALQLLGDPEPDPAPDAPETLSSRELDELEKRLALLTSRFAPPPATPMPSVEGPTRPATVAGRLEWAEGLEKILALLATSGRVMRAREIAAAIGEDASMPARIETTRGRCKRLVKEGKAVEVEPGCFQIAPQTSPAPMPTEEVSGMG